MSEPGTEDPIDEDLWLVRHHITRVVEWAIGKVGQAVLLASLGSIVAALLGADAVYVALIWSLVFGIVLWTAGGPYPRALPDEDDEG